MLSMALICRLSDVLLSRVEFGIAVNSRPMRKCPRVKTSASLTPLDGKTSGLRLRVASIGVRTVRN